MLTPNSFASAFPLALLACLCWGSWSCTIKAAAATPGYSFKRYYALYAAGAAACAAAAFGIGGDGRFFLCRSGGSEHYLTPIAAAVGAGAIFNVANVLLTLGVRYAGLAVAFPVGIGTALVLGTAGTYALDPAGNDPFLLFSGVALGALAVCASATAERWKEEEEEEEGKIDLLLLENENEREEKTSSLSATRKILLCGVAGIFMSCWSPLNAVAMGDTKKGCDDDDDENLGKLTAYSGLLAFAAGAAATTPALIAALPRENQDDAPVERRSTHTHIVLGLLGGAVWCIGTLANALAGTELGLALSYGIGQAAPMVATTWGVLYYREYDGAGRRSWACLGAMYLLFMGGIGLIAGSK